VETAVQQLQIRQSITAAIGGRQVGLDHPLAEGDHLHLFRLIGGG
jgi:sulfur carrier protein ThiS